MLFLLLNKNKVKETRKKESIMKKYVVFTSMSAVYPQYTATL